MEKLYTLAEVAEHLRLSKAHIYKLISEGKLRPHRIGLQHRFTEADIEAVIKPFAGAAE